MKNRRNLFENKILTKRIVTLGVGIFAVISLIFASVSGYADSTNATEKTINKWFPDVELAKIVASRLKVSATDKVSQSELNKITGLSCSNSDVKDLTGLRHLKGLKSLSFIENKKLEDLSELRYCENLTSLYAQKNNIKKLGSSNTLEKINLDCNELTSLGNVSWPKLKEISLKDNPLTDISGLKDSNELTSFITWVRSNNVTIKLNGKLDCLSNKENLNELTIMDASLKSEDMKPISTLKNLTKLGLDRNNVEDYSSLSRLKKLEYLGLSSSGITNTILKTLRDVNTKRLLMRYNKFGDLKMLNEFKAKEIEASQQNLSIIGQRLSDGTLTFKNPLYKVDGTPMISLKDYPEISYRDGVGHLNVADGGISSFEYNYRSKKINSYSISMDVKSVRNRSLRELVGSLKKKPKSNYTDESWNSLQQSIKRAETTLKKENVTQDEINKEEKTLEKAVNDLIEKKIVIKTLFPDPVLLKTVADYLKTPIDGGASQSELNKITGLSFSNSDIKDLTGLRHLKGLKSLIFIENKKLEDLSELRYCENLISLYAQKNSIKKLGSSNTLEKINLDCNELTSLGNVSWPKLKEISLKDNPLTDISGLKDSNQLTTLTITDVNENGKGSLNGKLGCLANKEHLTNLSILRSSLKDEDLEPISTLKNMDRLHLSGNHFTDFSLLAKIPKIKWLIIANSNLTNSAIKTMSEINVDNVSLDNNQITDLQALNNLKAKKIQASPQRITVYAKLFSDGKVTFEDPVIDIYGNPMAPIGSHADGLILKDGKFTLRNGNTGWSFGHTDKRIDFYTLYLSLDVIRMNDLENLITSLKDKPNNNYTNKSWNAFQAALQSAKDTMNKADTSQDEVDKQATLLKKAFDELLEKATSKKNLIDLIKEIDDLYWSQDYSSGYRKLIDAEFKGKKVIEEEDASQKDVDNAMAEINKAIDNLVLTGNAAIPIKQRLEEARVKFLELLNADRVSRGLNELAYSKGLNELADVRAEEQKTLYSHTRPDGTNVLFAGRRYGFNFLDECLADDFLRDRRGYQKNGEEIGETLYESWRTSPAHHAIMVSTPRQTHIGLSFVVNDKDTFRMYGALLIGWN